MGGASVAERTNLQTLALLALLAFLATINPPFFLEGCQGCQSGSLRILLAPFRKHPFPSARFAVFYGRNAECCFRPLDGSRAVPGVASRDLNALRGFRAAHQEVEKKVLGFPQSG